MTSPTTEALQALADKVEAGESCRSCKFWRIAEPQYTYGMCHRMPPTPDFNFTMKPSRYGDGGEVTFSRRADPIWPNTSEIDWCGEHRALIAGGRDGQA